MSTAQKRCYSFKERLFNNVFHVVVEYGAPSLFTVHFLSSEDKIHFMSAFPVVFLTIVIGCIVWNNLLFKFQGKEGDIIPILQRKEKQKKKK